MWDRVPYLEVEAAETSTSPSKRLTLSWVYAKSTVFKFPSQASTQRHHLFVCLQPSTLFVMFSTSQGEIIKK